MKVLLPALFCLFGFSASAQWLPFLKHKRYAALPEVCSAPVLVKATTFSKPLLTATALGSTAYSLSLNEHTVMKMAQHQMRFREYENASYSFNELAKIYVQLNKMSEAKWFFLQSNSLSRQQNNDRLTIANLIELASVKSTIGDFDLAQQDLDEARSLAAAHNWQDDLNHVQKSVSGLQRNKLVALKPEAGLAQTNEHNL
jgi:hypothetical protein